MAAANQKKRGYLRGVKGLLITPLEADGSMPATPVNYWVDTAQTVSIETEIVEGESSDLRGGDRVLTRVEDDDVIVGANLGFTNARFDAFLTEVIAGGTLITEVVDGEEQVIGWEAPTIAEQGEKIPFQAKVYVQSYNAAGGKEGYLEYEFRYCKGNAPSVEHGDQEWGTPEFEIKARENPSTGKSVYAKAFVDELPPEALE